MENESVRNHSHTDHEDALKQHAPLLSGIPKGNAPEPPAGYFETLEARTRQRMSVQASRPFWKSLRISIPLTAAACIAGIGLYIGLIRPSIPTSELNAVASVKETPSVPIEHVISSSQFAEDDIIEAILTFDEDEDAGWLSNLSIEQEQMAEVTPSETDQDDEDIISYLVNHDITMVDILDELQTN
ncbi:MAG: hypothetical protein H6585_07585 [Flavobacteriales bacterium]|nr:hypothetical protein [Flavobacteriales bacterium]MCB9448188.1 hypothetical protein [Flavobacteriales bacterium]